jgi:hypothetical protein
MAKRKAMVTESVENIKDNTASYLRLHYQSMNTELPLLRDTKCSYKKPVICKNTGLPLKLPKLKYIKHKANSSLITFQIREL